MTDFDSQALGNTAWAFARLGFWLGEPLLDAIALASGKTGGALHVQSHACLADAYGTSFGFAPTLHDRLRAHVVAYVHELGAAIRCFGRVRVAWKKKKKKKKKKKRVKNKL
eukprot:NODE_25244_length_594_cov_1.982869.p2 GENE.NODE_25244_length_594_cov_1.982869~~NODE_25244_length_594_cov_1.982869.p2  ORF type:complete len:111 (-),score=31.46 NODE_25244_length_594_cov_1.982869:106-438(-)